MIVLTTAVGAAGTPVSPGRAVVLVAVTVAAAALSWRVIEDPIRRGARLRWVTPTRATETSEANATGGADMTGEPDRNAAGGGRRPGRPRRPRAAAFAAGDRRALPAWRRRPRRGRDRVHAADLGDRGPRGAAAVGNRLDGERPAVQLGRRHGRHRQPGQAGDGGQAQWRGRAGRQGGGGDRRTGSPPRAPPPARPRSCPRCRRRRRGPRARPWCTSATPRRRG